MPFIDWLKERISDAKRGTATSRTRVTVGGSARPSAETRPSSESARPSAETRSSSGPDVEIRRLRELVVKSNRAIQELRKGLSVRDKEVRRLRELITEGKRDAKEMLRSLTQVNSRARQQADLLGRLEHQLKDIREGTAALRDQAYQQLVSGVRTTIPQIVPSGATIMVASKGDDQLVRLDGVRAWHFPRDPDGKYAGYYPATSEEAITHLESLRAQGAGYLVLPAPSLWWLDHYVGLRQHLESHHELIHSDGSCRVFQLSPPRDGDNRRRLLWGKRRRIKRAPALGDQSYQDLVSGVRATIPQVVPSGSTILVASKGDDQLVRLDGVRAWHFPRDPDGKYAGYYPATSEEAITHLESLRAQGAGYLVLPAPSLWWLDHYVGLRQHLESHHELIHSDGSCRVFQLGGNGSRPVMEGKKAAMVGTHSRPAARPSQKRAAERRPPTGPRPSQKRVTQPGPRPELRVSQDSAPISVVVTSHNKGPWLPEALRCIERQTVTPQEVIVVDDASSDDTAEVARRFKVRYERVEYRNPAKSRNHGANLAAGEYLCFYDADDLIGPGFLQTHLKALRDHPQAGFAYGRIQEFGERELLYPVQEWDHHLLRRRNYIPAATLIRRTAFRQVNGYPDLSGAEDWGLWVRLSGTGWTGVYCPELWRWRRMSDSRNARRTWGRTVRWIDEAPVSCMSMAIFAPFAGKSDILEEWFQTLRTVTWPRDNIDVWLYDNSCRDDFHSQLQKHASELEGFHAVHVVRDDEKIHESLYRYEEMARARKTQKGHHATWAPIADQASRIYTWAARNVRADFVVFLEDDVIPEVGGEFIELLMNPMNPNTQAVYGWYPSRLGNILVTRVPKEGESFSWRTGYEPLAGVTRVGGGGTGCVVVRGEVLEGRTFKATEPLRGADLNFSREMWEEGREMLCNWDVKCRHLVD